MPQAQPMAQPVAQPMPQAIPQPVPQRVVQPMPQPAVQSFTQPMAQPPAPEEPVVRALNLDRGDDVEEEVVGLRERAPFRDLLAAEGVGTRPRKLLQGGLIA